MSFVAGVANAGTCMLAVAVVVVVVEAAVGGKDFAVAVVDDFASSFPSLPGTLRRGSSWGRPASVSCEGHRQRWS